MQPGTPGKELTQEDIFLQELRSSTAQSHKRLEETELSTIIVSDKINNNDYARYLYKMYSFVKPFEDKAFPLLKNVFPDVENRRKANWLEKDLLFLQGDENNLKQMELYPLPETISEAYAVGGMYVIEGSVLGGKFIYKNVNAALGHTPEQGAVYFSGYGAETGKMWGSFVKQLSGYGVASSRKEEIFKGADDTFKTMYAILSA